VNEFALGFLKKVRLSGHCRNISHAWIIDWLFCTCTLPPKVLQKSTGAQNSRRRLLPPLAGATETTFLVAKNNTCFSSLIQ
jgi:hypothetical protein